MQSVRQRKSLTLYCPDPSGRVTGGFLYNHHLLKQLKAIGWLTEVVIDPNDEDDAFLHIVDSLYAMQYMQLRPLSSKAIFLYHLPPFFNQDIPTWWLDTERRLINQSRVIVTGTRAFDCLVNRHCIDHAKMSRLVSIFTPGIATHWQIKTEYVHLPKKLIVLGSIVPEKGIELIIDVLSALGDFDGQCTFYGEQQQNPDFYHYISQKVIQSGLNQRVNFAGTISHEEVNNVMLDADLLLNFSKFETYSMVTAEAIASGLPILSFPVGEMAEFRHANSICYVSSESFTEQCFYLQKLLTDSPFYQRLCAVNNMQQKTWPMVAQQWSTHLLEHDLANQYSQNINSLNEVDG